MKYLFPILITLMFVHINLAHSQKIHWAFLNSKIDTLMLFDPIGYIGSASPQNIIPNDSLTSVFLQLFYQDFMGESKFITIPLKNNHELSDSVQQYFANIMFRFTRLSNRLFYENTLSERISSVVQDIPGRYFGIICFSGYVNIYTKKSTTQNASVYKTRVLAPVSPIMMSIAPMNPFYNIYFAIIDKKENCIVYYQSYEKYRSPIKKSQVKNSIDWLLIGIQNN